jgi:hypothetical protein
MKRTIAILAIAIAATCAYSQVLLGDFEDAFSSFAKDMAGSLAVNSTLGSNWSDAYVGSFPHMGLGVTVGATFVGPDVTKKLFESMEADVPSGVDSVGIPIPAIVGTFKIGLPVIPLDLGIKLGFLPSSVAKSLMDSSDSEIDYMNYGVQLRYVLVKQKKGLTPNVSVGLAYNHIDGKISVPSGLDDQTFNIEGTPYYIEAKKPVVTLDWKSNTIDLTAQVSKKFFVLIPYLGAGLTFGKSTVNGGVTADVTSNYGNIDDLKDYLAASGISVPDELTDKGFTYTAAETSPLFRLYGGMSFRLIIIDLDAQAIYLPTTKSFGASLTGRIQF